MVKQHASEFSERLLEAGMPLLKDHVSEETVMALRAEIEDTAALKIVGVFKHLLDNSDDISKLDLEIHDKMQKLPISEFESLFQAVFNEDQGKLIFIGAFVGAAIGAVHAAVAIYFFQFQ